MNVLPGDIVRSPIILLAAIIKAVNAKADPVVLLLWGNKRTTRSA